MPAAVYPVTRKRGPGFVSDDNETCWNARDHSSKASAYSGSYAESGGKGLELASKHSVDCCNPDYFMPEMNGQEVAS